MNSSTATVTTHFCMRRFSLPEFIYKCLVLGSKFVNDKLYATEF
jgi:hypothetical protein